MPNKPQKRTVEFRFSVDGVVTKVRTEERNVYYRRKDGVYYINWLRGRKYVTCVDDKFVVFIAAKTIRALSLAEVMIKGGAV